MKNRMPQKKKRRNSVELTAIKRFEKSRSRRTCPAIQNTETVFCGDWGRASTSMKLCFALLAAFPYPAFPCTGGKQKDGLGRPSLLALILPVRFHLQFDILADTLPALAVQRQNIRQ